MGKLTHEEFIKIAKSKNEKVKNGSIEVRGQYLNADTKILCHCNIHDVDWYATPDRIYYGAGCPQCIAMCRKSQRLSHGEFVKRVKKKNEHIRNGDVEIRGKYSGSQERIECYCNIHNVTWFPIAASLYKNIGCRECGKEDISAKKTMTHQEFVDSLRLINSGLTVLSEYTGMYNKITVQTQCGHVWTTNAVNVYHKDFKCPYCNSQAILVGFNDLWTTAPEVATLLTNPEDGYTLTKLSGQKKSFTCPLCGKEQYKYINNITQRGFTCIYCADTISYPNKFGRAFLDQVIGDDYQPECHAEWAKPYSYDNLFVYNGQCFVLEMDGGLHSQEHTMSKLSLEERQEIDRIKDELAYQHNVHMIRIDCLYSDCEYISTNMINSELSELFDLSKVDWQKCDIQAQKNLVKEACDMYVSGVRDVSYMSNKLKISERLVKKYLQKGSQFGWCEYDPKEVRKPSNNYKIVVVTNVVTGDVFEFKGRGDCERNIYNVCGIHVSAAHITKCCSTGQIYQGFTFKYIKPTIQN